MHKNSTKVNPRSGRLRSPSASPNTSVESTGRNVNSEKGKNKVDQPMAIFDVFVGHSIIDYDSSGGESLDEEFWHTKSANSWSAQVHACKVSS